MLNNSRTCTTVLYLNCNGLPNHKLNKIIDYSNHHQNTIIFLAETWHINASDLLRHPYVIASSKNSNRRQTGHQNGGIICLAHPQLHEDIDTMESQEYFLTLRIRSRRLTIAPLYFPPSLDPEHIKNILNTIDARIIIGDTNVRYGKMFSDNQTGPRNRMDIFSDWTTQNGYIHRIPSSGRTRTDHLFTDTTTGIQQFICEPPIVHTDHPSQLLLHLSINDPREQQTCSEYDSRLPTIRYNLKKLVHNEFKQALHEGYTNIKPLITSILSDIKDACHPRHKNPELQQLIDQADETILIGIQTVAEEVLGKYSVEEAKCHPDKLLEELSNISSHRRAVKTFKRSMRAEVKKITSQDPEKSPIQEAVEFLGSIYRQDRDDLKIGGSTDNEIRIGTRHMEYPWNEDDIKKRIHRYSNTKSCGSDGIHTIILKMLTGSGLVNHLNTLFQSIWMTGLTPKRWNESLVFPIPKKHGATFIQDCRPISLTVMFRRIFESMLLRTLESHTLTSKLRDFHPAQAGFRRGYSTLTHTIVSNDRSTWRKPARVFVDLKQAYDRVPIVKLIGILAERDTPNIITKIIRGLFTDGQARVVVNNRTSIPYSLERGLFQGSILSPFLFTVFIDPLIRNINRNSPQHQWMGLFFADDIQFISYDDRELQIAIDILTEWCHLNGMLVGISKCGSMGTDTTFRICDLDIPKTTEYQYLGFPTTTAGINWEAHLAKRHRQALGILIRLKNHANWGPDIKLIIFKTFIRPLWEYGAPILYSFCMRNSSRTETLLKPLEDLQNECIAWICNNPPHGRLGIAASVLAVPKICDRFGLLSLAAVDHFKNCNKDNPLHSLEAFWRYHPILPSHTLHRQVLSVPGYSHMVLETGPDLSKRTWLKLRAINIVKGYGNMASIISNHCRWKNGPDALIKQEITIANRALRWRLNSCFHGSYCPICKTKFNRGHIRCFHSATNTEWHPDTLLNQRRYEEFGVIYNAIKNWLRSDLV